MYGSPQFRKLAACARGDCDLPPSTVSFMVCDRVTTDCEPQLLRSVSNHEQEIPFRQQTRVSAGSACLPFRRVQLALATQR